MRDRKRRLFVIAVVLVLGWAAIAGAQSKGLKAISAENMKFHMQFLAAKEFQGRNTPSVELDIASKYIALVAQQIGLKPLLPNGSYYQEVPVEVTSISPAKSYLRVVGGMGERKFYFPQGFTTTTRTGGSWSVAGDIVFLGSGQKAEDFEGIDLRGKIAVALEVPLPPAPAGAEVLSVRSLPPGLAAQAARGRLLREKGALGQVTIISQAREDNLLKKGLTFDISERTRFHDVDTRNPALPAAQPTGTQPAVAFVQPAAQAPFYTAEVRHEAGATILGLSMAELEQVFEALAQQKPVPPKAITGTTLDIAVLLNVRTTKTLNVVAYLPGSDAKLKEEYVTISSHHDHLPMREGRIFPGADDNISGGVAMFEIAKALLVERPKRSVIFIWNTAEEKGLVGSYYFVQHCPVPVEKISANLNLDMVSRSDPNSLYIIGSNKLSTEFDKSIKDMNARTVGLKLDYKYDDPGEPSRFFFRSDQYPYIRYGIPGVWLFSGTTPDYHQETDLEERIDYKKMEKVTKLAYAVAIDIGNKPALCKLDVNPEITTRGKHNMKIVWQRPPQPQQKR